MAHAHEQLPLSADGIVDLLKTHAADTLQSSPSNARYAEGVRGKAEEVRELIETRAGSVKSVAATWIEDMRPIMEALFGINLEGHQLGEYAEYRPTVFDGISGRARIVSVDETWGPALILDLTALKQVGPQG